MKPEVTISEYDISKKWYEYEKKIGSPLKLPSTMIPSKYSSPKRENYNPPVFSLSNNINILGNLKIPKKLSSVLNPLVDHKDPSFQNTSFDKRETKESLLPVSSPNRKKVSLMSIRQYDQRPHDIQEMKCCDCEVGDHECHILVLQTELNKSTQSNVMRDHELTQLSDLNRQLVDRLELIEDYENCKIDQHFEYEHIQQGFDKICKNFSDTVDPALGNLSVRGATKKMLLNLQKFAYEQIAMLKVQYIQRIENVKHSFAEEIDELNEALADSCIKTVDFKLHAETIIENHASKVDNTGEIIADLRSRLALETQRADLMTDKFTKVDKELTELKESHEDLKLQFLKLTEKCEREVDMKLNFKERLEDIENKYQNVSISTMHSKLTSLKTQIDLQKLEDAKKLYEKGMIISNLYLL